MVYLGIMLLQWWNSYGDVTLVQLRNLSKNVWMHMAIMILALRARHQISPWWLEMAVKFLSLSLGLSRKDGND